MELLLNFCLYLLKGIHIRKWNSRIKDTSEMLDITDDIKNNNMITDSSILVSFDMTNIPKY